jgi:ABC-type multidrug transport system ATPase subunit
MIVTTGLTKRFGRVLAVDHVDLEVQAADRYGFLGPNGSGKTTLVRMLLGLVYATSGEIEVLGQPVPARIAKVLPQVGALVEAPSAYGHLSGRANLALLDAAGPRPAGAARLTARGARHRRRRIDDALARVGLAGVDNRSVSKYSLGMKQRLGLAAALLREPRLLVLDEPTNGLDPRGIREIRDLLAEVNQAGTTVFLSSHQLAEVELLCTRVGVIDRGRLVLQDDLSALRQPTGRAVVRSPDADRAAALLAGRVAARHDDLLIVTGADPAELNTELVSAGLRVSEVRAERRSLEDLVLAVTSASSDRIDDQG